MKAEAVNDDIYSQANELTLGLLELALSLNKESKKTDIDGSVIYEQALEARKSIDKFIRWYMETDWKSNKLIQSFQIMNIYARPGTKVRFSHPENGSIYNQKTASHYLTVGDIYTVREVAVDHERSMVAFFEVPFVWFNTVMFSDIQNRRRGPYTQVV